MSDAGVGRNKERCSRGLEELLRGRAARDGHAQTVSGSSPGQGLSLLPSDHASSRGSSTLFWPL